MSFIAHFFHFSLSPLSTPRTRIQPIIVRRISPKSLQNPSFDLINSIQASPLDHRTLYITKSIPPAQNGTQPCRSCSQRSQALGMVHVKSERYRKTLFLERTSSGHLLHHYRQKTIPGCTQTRRKRHRGNIQKGGSDVTYEIQIRSISKPNLYKFSSECGYSPALTP